MDRAAFRAGLRAGVPIGIAVTVVAVSFAVVAEGAGLGGVAAVVMSAVVFAASAQFAAVAILAGGGSAGAAIVAATLINSRFLPMGAALAPSLPGGPIKRAVQGQALVDASWAVAARGDGTFDRWVLFGTTLPQYVGWVAGTIAGVFTGDAIGDPKTYGLDAVYPAFFVALLMAEVKTPRGRLVALLGALVALALVPLAPAGVPVLAASAAALVGLRSRPGSRS